MASRFESAAYNRWSLLDAGTTDEDGAYSSDAGLRSGFSKLDLFANEDNPNPHYNWEARMQEMSMEGDTLQGNAMASQRTMAKNPGPMIPVWNTT